MIFGVHSDRRLSQLVVAASTAALLVGVGCGGSDGVDEASGPSNEPIESLEFDRLEGAQFDVDWRAGTSTARRSTIDKDVINPNTANGVYRIDADSALVSDISVDDVVVWPSLGVFRVLDVSEQGETVEVDVESEELVEAAEEAQISFGTDSLTGGSISPVAVFEESVSQSGQNLEALRTNRSALMLSNNGASISRTIRGFDVSAAVDTATDSTTATLNITHQDVPTNADAEITVDNVDLQVNSQTPPGSDEVTTEIRLQNIDVQVDTEVKIQGIEGNVDVVPPIDLTFPFMVGPVPFYLSIGTEATFRSTLQLAEDFGRASASYDFEGSFTLQRSADGSVNQTSGTIDTFDANGGLEMQTGGTAGVSLIVETPRIGLGMGRPGTAAAEIYGAPGAEITANLSRNDGENCLSLDTNGAILAGGSLTLFSIGYAQEGQLATRQKNAVMKGEGC